MLDRWFSPRGADAAIRPGPSVLATHPGRVTEILDRRFRVVAPWPHLGPTGCDGAPVLSHWPAGTEAYAGGLLFESGEWRVRLDHDGDGLQLPLDAHYPEVPLHHFLACTEPLEPPPLGPDNRWSACS